MSNKINPAPKAGRTDTPMTHAHCARNRPSMFYVSASAPANLPGRVFYVAPAAPPGTRHAYVASVEVN